MNGSEQSDGVMEERGTNVEGVTLHAEVWGNACERQKNTDQFMERHWYGVRSPYSTWTGAKILGSP